MIKLLFLFLDCVFVRVVDHGVNEGEPVDEQYREQVNEDQFCDPRTRRTVPRSGLPGRL